MAANLTFVFDGYLADRPTPLLFVFDGYLIGTEVPVPLPRAFYEPLGSKAFKRPVDEEDEEEVIFATIQAFLQCH